MKRLQFILVFLSLVKFSSQEKSINEVIIEGKFLSLPYRKVSENIEIITREQIKKIPANSIEDLLSYCSGIDVRKRGVSDLQADVSIRGGSFEQVLLMVNGVRMNDSQTGHNMMNIPFNLDSVERIEIIKGPAARRFGQNAYSGAINIVTKITGEGKYSISTTGGDFGTWSLGGSVDFGGEKFGNFIQINKSKSLGYRDNTDYDIKNIWYNNQFRIPNGKLRLQAGFVEKKFGANGFFATSMHKEQYEEIQNSLVSAIYEQKYRNIGINASLYWRRAQDMYVLERNNPVKYRNMHIGNNYGGELNISYKSLLGVTGIGTDLHEEDLRSNNLGSRNRFVNQVFAEHHFSFFKNKLAAIPGISWVNYPSIGNFFYPGLDLGFSVNNQVKLYTNIAKVHRVPSYTDLYYKSSIEQGNPNLKPENATSYELGLNYENGLLSFKAGLFGRRSKNSIDWTKTDDQSIWTAENVSKITTNGVEIEASYRISSFVRDISMGYTYLDNEAVNKDLGINSRYGLENLRHQYNAKLNLAYQKFIGEIIYQYNNRVSLENYNLLDAKISFNIRYLETFLVVNNICNTKYTGANLVPMPMRWFQLGLKIKGKF